MFSFLGNRYVHYYCRCVQQKVTQLYRTFTFHTQACFVNNDLKKRDSHFHTDCPFVVINMNADGLEFSESHAFVLPSAGGHCLLDWLLDLIGAETVVVDHPRLQLFSEGICRAKLDRGHLPLEF